jgi:hypothetical protein
MQWQANKIWKYIGYHVVSKAKTGLPKHKMVPTHKTTFCNFITENYQTRVESLSGIIDKLGRNRLGPRDKELKIMRLLCDTGVPKLMPRRVVACDADGGM